MKFRLLNDGTAYGQLAYDCLRATLAPVSELEEAGESADWSVIPIHSQSSEEAITTLLLNEKKILPFLFADLTVLSESIKDAFRLLSSRLVVCLSPSTAERARALGLKNAVFLGKLKAPAGLRLGPEGDVLRVAVFSRDFDRRSKAYLSRILAQICSESQPWPKPIELITDLEPEELPGDIKDFHIVPWGSQAETDLYLSCVADDVFDPFLFSAIEQRIPCLALSNQFSRDFLPAMGIFSGLTEAAERFAALIAGMRPGLNECPEFDSKKFLGLVSRCQTFETPPEAIGEPEFTEIGMGGRIASWGGRVLSGCRPKRPTITLWGEMKSGPYGGGSQVLKAIAKELAKRGYHVQNNSYFPADGHVLNSGWFNQQLCEQVVFSGSRRPKVVHRIDGPISLYRQTDLEIDAAFFRLNRRIATTTAFQSYYSWAKCLELGLTAINPVIIRNACDPSLFYPSSPKDSDVEKRKVKLVSSSWSTNKLKGFDVYEYLDQTLDFSRYDYTFVGRSPIRFKNIKMVDALPSGPLGELLRQKDIFIFASHNDSASNALLEAITCGLPTIYADTGGSREFGWLSSRPFQLKEEIPGILEEVSSRLPAYRALCRAKHISEVVDQYLRQLELPLGPSS